MFDSTESRNAVLTVLGGALWTLVLPLWPARLVLDYPPVYVGLAAVVPVLLGLGVLEIRTRYGERYGSLGRAGVVLTGLGLALLAVAILLFAAAQPVFVSAVADAGIPGALGIVVLAVGSAFLAGALYRLDVVGPAAAALLGLGIPLLIPIYVLLRVLVPGGLDPVGIVPMFGGAPYGVGWLLVGHRLAETAGGAVETDATGRLESVGVSPQVATAAVVGAIYLLFGAGRVLPPGPLSVHWLTTESYVLDVSHLLVGIAGLVAARRDAGTARSYNRAVGLLSLLVVGVAPLQLEALPGLGWLPPRATLVNVVLDLPAGVVLGVVGFGIDGETDVGEPNRESE